MKTEIFSFVENVGSFFNLLQILETSGGGDRGRAPENIPGASILGGGSHPALCLLDPPLSTSLPPASTHTVPWDCSVLGPHVPSSHPREVSIFFLPLELEGDHTGLAETPVLWLLSLDFVNPAPH